MSTRNAQTMNRKVLRKSVTRYEVGHAREWSNRVYWSLLVTIDLLHTSSSRRSTNKSNIV